MRLELIDTQLGVYEAPGPREILTTGEDGRVEVPDAPLLPLDVRAERGQGWSVAFVHGARRIDETQPMDLVGAQPRVLTLEDTTAVVLERSGTLVVEVAGAKADDVFHVTFVDDRPEPFSHRSVRATRSFRGPRGELEMPRPRLPLRLRGGDPRRAGALGRAGRWRGALSRVRAPRRHDSGRAPHGRRALHDRDGALRTDPLRERRGPRPDGATPVGTFPFRESPLRFAARLPIAMGTGYEADAHLGVRMPKHFLRAAGVPLVRPEEERPEGAPERTTAPPPLDLTFAVDLGGKLRLPEMESGWVLIATNAALIRGGPAAGFQTRFVEQIELGVIELPRKADPRVPRRGQVLEPLPPEPSWTSWLVLRNPDGTPAPFREVLVSLRDGTLARAMADGEGRLEVRGARGEEILAAPAGAPGRRVQLTRASTAAEPAVLVLSAGRARVTGRWTREAGGAPVVGVVVGLLPLTEDEVRTRSRFMTRAFPVAITDRDGSFRVSRPGARPLRAPRRAGRRAPDRGGGRRAAACALRLVGMNEDVALDESGG